MPVLTKDKLQNKYRVVAVCQFLNSNLLPYKPNTPFLYRFCRQIECSTVWKKVGGHLRRAATESQRKMDCEENKISLISDPSLNGITADRILPEKGFCGPDNTMRSDRLKHILVFGETAIKMSFHYFIRCLIISYFYYIFHLHHIIYLSIHVLCMF